jgi:hypothetical protein
MGCSLSNTKNIRPRVPRGVSAGSATSAVKFFSHVMSRSRSYRGMPSGLGMAAVCQCDFSQGTEVPVIKRSRKKVEQIERAEHESRADLTPRLFPMPTDWHL